MFDYWSMYWSYWFMYIESAPHILLLGLGADVMCFGCSLVFIFVDMWTLGWLCALDMACIVIFGLGG